jgi:hypothetical protein
VSSPSAEVSPALPVPAAATDAWIPERIAELPRRWHGIHARAAALRLQIIVTELPVGGAAVTHRYRVDEEYVYPASAIKLFGTVAMLLRLQELRGGGAEPTLDTPLGVCRSRTRPCGPTPDASNTRTGVATLGHELRKVHLVSDNDAFNRIYDFVGHRELNETWWRLGLDRVRVTHRMFEAPDPVRSRTTPRMLLFVSRASAVEIPARTSDLAPAPPELPGLQVGTAWLDAGRARVEGGFDFTTRNFASVEDLHALLLAVVVPERGLGPGLAIAPQDRAVLLEAMTQLPAESEVPRYDDPALEPRRFKPLLPGVERVLPAAAVRYVNKGGRAYGFLVENAYIEDRRTGAAIAVTVAVFCDGDGVLNDDHYDYDGIGWPLLADLGEVLARKLSGG